MSFLNPLFLLAVAAVGLPIAIHLLNLRRPSKVSFSTLSFFNELKKTTIRRIKIKQLILLLLRAAAVLCLALVLARPFLPPDMAGASADNDEPSFNTILLDNSISMARIDAGGPLFDQAKNIITQLAEQSEDEDRFILQLSNGQPFPMATMNKNELQNLLENADIQKSGNYTEQRINLLNEYAASAPFKNKKLFILTDGQPSQFEFLEDRDAGDLLTNISVSWIKVGRPDVQNTFISSVRSATTIGGVGTPYMLEIEVTNSGNRLAVNQYLSLQFDGQSAGQYALELKPGESQVYTFEVIPGRTGDIPAKLLIEGDEFSEDNTYFLSVSVPDSRDILWITENDAAGSEFDSYTGIVLKAAAENNAQLNYTQSTLTAFNSKNLSNYDAVLFDGIPTIPEYLYPALTKFVQDGQGILFFPSEKGDIPNYNSFLSQLNAGRYVGLKGEYASFNPVASIDELPVGHPILDNIFDNRDEEEIKINPPKLYYYLNFKPFDNSNGIGLIRSAQGDQILYEQPFGNGTIIVSAIGNDPGWSNLPVNSLFAPLYYKTVLYTASFDQGGLKTHTLGSPFVYQLPMNAEEAELEVNGNTTKPEIVPQTNAIQVVYPAAEWTPGWVHIKTKTDEQIVGVNVPAGESLFAEEKKNEYLLTRVEEELNADVVETFDLNEMEINSELQQAGFGKEIWTWFMWAAFVFLLAETAISIWFKTDNT